MRAESFIRNQVRIASDKSLPRGGGRWVERDARVSVKCPIIPKRGADVAKFLTTKACSSEIEEMVRQAGEIIWLISPYIKIDGRLKERLQARDRAGVDMRLVYGKKELRKRESEWLNSLDSLEIRYRANLHAKCYMNENEALITSLNLYEYSQINNDEWGILVSRTDDEELYQRIFEEAVHIFENAVVEKEPVKHSQPAKARASGQKRAGRKKTKRSQKRAARRKPALPETGVCIRKGEPIGFDLSKPYCDKCFKRWNRYKNREYPENKCHVCGQDWISDIDRPLCLDCYRKYGGMIAAHADDVGFEPETGVCIRKGESIGFDLSTPYCRSCFKSWNKYKNREYEESMCHMCGREGPAAMERPICRDCYLNVAHAAAVRVLGDDYVPWASDGDDM